MTKPNFLFIGPDKTGSSWLHKILREHPDCFVPVAKDLWFFDRYYDKGMDWYLSYFDKASEEAEAVGELSHNYLFSEKAARRIAADLPEVKLLTCLRDPVERTFSQYLYLRRSGITKLPFPEALDEFPRLINNSMYYKHLSAYLDYFPRKQLKTLWFSDLKDDPEEFAKEVFRFLDLSFVNNIGYHQRVRSAGEARSFYVAKILKWLGLAARKLGLANMVGYIKNNTAVNKVFYQSYDREEKPKMEENIESELREKFSEDVSSLEELLDVNLKEWK